MTAGTNDTNSSLQRNSIGEEGRQEEVQDDEPQEYGLSSCNPSLLTLFQASIVRQHQARPVQARDRAIGTNHALLNAIQQALLEVAAAEEDGNESED